MLVEIITSIVAKSIYPLIFLLMVIEGPITTFLASMYSATSNLNIYIIFSLAVLGDFTGDLIYYFIGRKISPVKYEKKERKIKDKKLFHEIEKTIKNNFFISLIIIKITPLSGIGLTYLGRKKANIKKYISYSLLTSLILNTIIAFAGYSLILSLKEFLNIQNQLNLIGIILLIFIIIAFLIYYSRNYLNQKYFNLLKRFEK